MDKAETAFCDAVLMQADSVDGNMGLSEVYAEQQEFSKLRAVLEKLLNIDEVFREEQRHKFNEFGINLRKKELYDDAIRFYIKALEVNDLDENLHFNTARAYYAKGMLNECRTHLNRALELNSAMREAVIFLRAIESESSAAGRAERRAEKGREAECRERVMRSRGKTDSSKSMHLDINF